MDEARNAIERAWQAPPQGTEYLSFTLAGEAYAFELARIQSIIQPPTLTEVPRAPSFVLGVCSVRGALVTVLDLRRRLSVPETPWGRHCRILLTQTAAGETLGLLVDAVRHVVRPLPDEIEMAQSVMGGELPDYVLAIVRVRHEREQKSRKKRTDQAPVRERAQANTERQGIRPAGSKEDSEVIVILDLDNICGLSKSESMP